MIINGYLKELDRIYSDSHIPSNIKKSLVDDFYRCNSSLDIIRLTNYYRNIAYRLK